MRKNLMVLFLVVATELIGFGLIVPVLPLLAKQFETNAVMIGILMSSYSFAQFISSPILGSLSDYYGRKNILILSKIGTIIGYLLMAISHSFLPFLLARLIDGFTGGNISVARAYVTDITNAENRSKGMAVIGIAFGTGFILGPAIGGFLYQEHHVNHLVPALFAASLSFVALMITIFFLKEPQQKTTIKRQSFLNSFYQVFNEKIILLLLFISLIYMVIFSGFETSFSLFTHYVLQFNIKQNSWLFVYAGVLGMITQGVIMSYASKKVKPYCMLGLATLGTGFVVMSLTNQLWILLIGMAFFSVGTALSNTYLPTVISLYTKENKGAAMGIYEGFTSLSRVIGPLILLPIVQKIPSISYRFFGITLILLALLLFIVKSKHKNHFRHE